MTTGAHNEQHNTGYNVFSNQGTGDQHIHPPPPNDAFGGGGEAIKNRLYPQAVKCYEEYLSTALPSSAGQQNGSMQKAALAHFYAAVALLGKSPPRYKLPNDINRINEHLDQARELGRGFPVFHQANVLWAIVKEDHYQTDGQEVPEPAIEELRNSIPHLGAGELGVFVEHMASLTTTTWRRLAEHASELGIELEVPNEDTSRKVDKKRPEAVRKYFTKTPDPVTRIWAIIWLTAAVTAIVSGVVLGGSMTVILLAGAGYLLFLSAVRYIDYRAYLQEYANAEPKPSDSEMDRWLEDDLIVLTRRAGTRLRLNTRLAHKGGDLLRLPLTVVGIPDSEEFFGRFRRVKVWKGDDGKLRANYYDVYILFLTQELVSTYRCLLNFGTGNLIYDEADEYHYRDIVGVHSWSIPVPRKVIEVLESEHGIGTEPSLAERAALTIASGQVFEINIGIASRGRRNILEVAWQNKHALNTLQKMIRAHHNHWT